MMMLLVVDDCRRLALLSPNTSLFSSIEKRSLDEKNVHSVETGDCARSFFVVDVDWGEMVRRIPTKADAVMLEGSRSCFLS